MSGLQGYTSYAFAAGAFQLGGRVLDIKILREVQGLGVYRVEGLGFRVYGLEFAVPSIPTQPCAFSILYRIHEVEGC